MATELGATTASITTSHAGNTRAVSTGEVRGPRPARSQDGPESEQPTLARGEVDRELLEKSVASVRDHIQAVHRSINFEVDDTSGETLVKVVDPESGDLIRQLPPESLVATAQILAELAKKGSDGGIKGLLLEAEA